MKKIITGLFAIAAFTFSASAQNPNNTDQKNWNKDGQGMHRGHDGRGRGMEKLNLTDAQKQQMKSVNEDFKTRMQALNKNDNMMVKDFKAQRGALLQERKNKVSAILTPEQKTKFEQFRKNGEGRNKGGERFGKGRAVMMDHMKTNLGLTDDQVAKIKSGSESFKQRGKAIHENQALSTDQKKEQFETLRKEREVSFKSYLTAEQITKLDQMKKNRGDWKEKRKSEDGKEKIKTKTT